MKGKRSIDDRVRQLNALNSEPIDNEGLEKLTRALGDSRGALVAAAARVVLKAELAGLQPVLIAAFDRFMQRPETTDKGCHAKTQIARALYHTNADAGADAVFLRGIRHVQPEPVWGGKEDTAVELRVTCALALARAHHPQTMLELARLLADSEVMARVGAANAIAYAGWVDSGVVLLRFKVLVGDADVRVTSACLSALLTLDAEPSLPFVAEWLESPRDELCEAAAMALGESRLEAARPLLERASEQAVTSERRRALMLGLAMLRSQVAWDYLLAAVARESLGPARDALQALAIFAHEPALRTRVREAVEARGDAELTALAATAFA